MNNGDNITLFVRSNSYRLTAKTVYTRSIDIQSCLSHVSVFEIYRNIFVFVYKYLDNILERVSNDEAPLRDHHLSSPPLSAWHFTSRLDLLKI